MTLEDILLGECEDNRSFEVGDGLDTYMMHDLIFYLSSFMTKVNRNAVSFSE